MILCGDCREVLLKFADGRFSLVLCDPPYGLRFLGKKWDASVPGREAWAEVFRVMKPGAFLAAFGGTRTWHRLAVEIEEAGFEIVDTAFWFFGQGYPKSVRVGAAIDAALGAQRASAGPRVYPDGHVQRYGGGKQGFGDWKGEGTQEATFPATPEGLLWEGFGTRLKPGCEPILIAMKPREGTIVENVLAHGTGAMHIDACRIAGESSPSVARRKGKFPDLVGQRSDSRMVNRISEKTFKQQRSGEALGRFPTNVVLSDEPEVLDLLPLDALGRPVSRFFSRIKYCPKAGRSERDYGLGELDAAREDTSSTRCSPTNVRRCEECGRSIPAGSSESCPRCGSARISFSPAAMDGTGRDRSSSRTVNDHATLKPVELMRWLVLLLGGQGGEILDPFCGSGTTGVAAKMEGFPFVGIEIDPKFARIARARIRATTATQGEMFR